MVKTSGRQRCPDMGKDKKARDGIDSLDKPVKYP